MTQHGDSDNQAVTIVSVKLPDYHKATHVDFLFPWSVHGNRWSADDTGRTSSRQSGDTDVQNGETGDHQLKMIPVQYIESICKAKLPPYEEDSCMSVCGLKSSRRCRECVILSQGMAPQGYKDSIISYIDCTKRRYKSVVEYTPKMKPRAFEETCFLSPKYLDRVFVAYKDYCTDGKASWFTNGVLLKPKMYSSKTVCKVNCDDVTKTSLPNGHVNGLVNGYTENGYASSEDLSDASSLSV